MVRQHSVRVDAHARVVGMHGRRRQPGYSVDQGVFGLDCERVRLYHGQLRIDDDVCLGPADCAPLL